MTEGPRGRRALSPTQAATQARMLDAAAALADARGYDGFTMRDVAAAAGVSPATAYHYYRSKDHLLVDVLVGRGAQTSEAVGRRTTSGGGDAARLVSAFTKVVQAHDRQPLLYQAMFRAYVNRPAAADDAGDAGAAPWSGRSWLDRAVDDDLPDRDAIVELLQALVLSSMISLIVGTPSTDVIARFRSSVRVLPLSADPSRTRAPG